MTILHIYLYYVYIIARKSIRSGHENSHQQEVEESTTGNDFYEHII